MSIRQNIKTVREKIANAAKKSGNNSDIIIVCVSKNRAIGEIYQVFESGINHIGESKIQEAMEKYRALSEYARGINSDFNFHMVGHLQTNKVSKAVGMFGMIQSVDSLRLAQKIDAVSREEQLTTDVLIEVNTSQEKSKFGADSDDVITLLKEISKLDNIFVRGLMTMAPLGKNKEDARLYFSKLRLLRDRINETDKTLFGERVKMDFLSMGMSQDYEIAVQEGANMLRIGTAIFEGES